MRSLLPTLLAAALVSMPVALAQVPTAPTPIYTVAIMNAPAEFGTLEANGSASAPFQVVLTLGNVVCAAAVTIPVTLTATASGAPAFFSVALDPPVLNMTVSQGPHGSPPAGEAAVNTGDSTARATITGNISVNASVQVSITATAPAPPAPPTGCQGAGAIGDATSAPVVIFANMTAPPPPPEPTPTDEDTPGPGVLALVAALAAVALGLRRKRAA